MPHLIAESRLADQRSSPAIGLLQMTTATPLQVPAKALLCSDDVVANLTFEDGSGGTHPVAAVPLQKGYNPISGVIQADFTGANIFALY